MNLIKNTVFTLCIFFLLTGCLRFSSKDNKLQNLNAANITFDQQTYPVIILGGGIAGLTTSIYMAQANIDSVLIEGPTPGGAITKAYNVRNWPGEINISGKQLSQNLHQHAIKNGVKILQEKVIDVDFSVWPYLIKIENLIKGKTETLKALSCIIAMGANPIKLNIPGEKEYLRKGISFCAICDGPTYKDKTIAIVGGSKRAMHEALYLSNIAKDITILVRSEKLRAKGKIVEEVLSKPNIKILYDTQVKQITGNKEKITHLIIQNNKENKEETIKIDGLFVAIGYEPNSNLFKEQLELDAEKHIKISNSQETSKIGIFAAGDISNPKHKQAIIAAGDGCKAALQAQTFLEKIGYKKTMKQEEKQQKEKQPEESFFQIEEISDLQELEKIISTSKIPVIVNLYSPLCMPCQRMHPIMNQLATHFKTKVKFIKINISKNPAIAQKFWINSIPALIFIDEGKEIKKLIGARNFENLKELIQNTFNL